jgi:hypothetical protein
MTSKAALDVVTVLEDSVDLLTMRDGVQDALPRPGARFTSTFPTAFQRG